MADKIIKITLDQLNDIVSDAVTNAIKKLDNVEIIEAPPRSLHQQSVLVNSLMSNIKKPSKRWLVTVEPVMSQR